MSVLNQTMLAILKIKLVFLSVIFYPGPCGVWQEPVQVQQQQVTLSQSGLDRLGRFAPSTLNLGCFVPGTWGALRLVP